MLTILMTVVVAVLMMLMLTTMMTVVMVVVVVIMLMTVMIIIMKYLQSAISNVKTELGMRHRDKMKQSPMLRHYRNGNNHDYIQFHTTRS